MLVYSVLDRKMKEYQSLWTERNDETCRRGLLSIKGTGSILDKFPEDYDVFCVAEFDQESGRVLGVIPRLVVNLAELLEASNGAR